jgi:hypothetical protein
MAGKQPLTFSTNALRPFVVAFGAFVALVALAPTAIVTLQWLALMPRGKVYTDPGSIIPGAAIVLWGVWLMTSNERVIVDAAAGTVEWRKSVFGFSWRSSMRRKEEIEAIEVKRISGVRSATYTFTARGAWGRRTVLSGARRASEQRVREMGKILEVPMQQ